jgi:Immunoglobulin-like domain of bacterial spore germination
MRQAARTAISIIAVLLSGCNFAAPPPPEATLQPTSAPPTTAPTASLEPTFTPESSATASGASPEASAVPIGGGAPEEAILIFEPGPASFLTSPIHVEGLADPTFEQTLVVRIVLADGTEVVTQPTTIAADVGQRGPFQADLFFNIPGGANAFIQVFSQSPRDGGITHVASVGVTLGSGGGAMIVPGQRHPEDIIIAQPQTTQSISGGKLHVEGIAVASFEQTLVIELLDADGIVVASQPVIVNAPDLGQPGPFAADIPYNVTTSGPGRVVVRDISPAFGGDVHLASVEVSLNP